MKICSLDAGFGYVKYYDGTQLEKIVSLVSPARRIKFNFDFKNKNLKEVLHIKLNNKEYFIGDFAREQGVDPFQVLDKDKIYHESTHILIKTILGLFPKDSDLKIVTGLPVSSYGKDQKEFLSKVLKGNHSISFMTKEPFESNYNVTDVLVIPQPIGSLFDILLNDVGEIKEDKQKLAESTIAIIDIGFGTTDFAIIRDLEYIDKNSRSIGIGVKDILEIVREEIAYLSKEEIPLYEVERLVTLGRGDIKIKGKTFSIQNTVKEAASIIFNKMKTLSNYLWDKEKTIDIYMLTGGGLYLLGGEFKKFYGDQITTLFIDNPSFSNVKGFYKYGVRKWSSK